MRYDWAGKMPPVQVDYGNVVGGVLTGIAN